MLDQLHARTKRLPAVVSANQAAAKRARRARLTQEELVGVVEDAGFDGRLLGGNGDAGVARLHVDGMLCSACSGKIEAALCAQPGVTDASANLLTHKVEVRRLPPRASLLGLPHLWWSWNKEPAPCLND